MSAGNEILTPEHWLVEIYVGRHLECNPTTRKSEVNDDAEKQDRNTDRQR